ncbi:S-layer homology domain-containing protein [Candidatus Peregrinibacteria bacterium]|nr:S-layer homology domain-containing protein [Candidatus Peregrinibacteria bacterium]
MIFEFITQFSIFNQGNPDKYAYYCKLQNLAANASDLLAVSSSDTPSSVAQRFRSNFAIFVMKNHMKAYFKKYIGTVLIVAFLGTTGTSYLFDQTVMADSQVGPTAVLQVSPTGGSIQTTFTFDASLSTNARGSRGNLDYRINFEYSSSSFTTWNSVSQFDYTYTQSGNKKVILDVRDRETGLTDRAILSLNVGEKLSWNAEIAVSPLKGDSNTSFRFQMQMTSDLATPVTDYEVRWDFDGDNAWDTRFSNQHTAYHLFSKTGYFTPKAEARDPSGNTVLVFGLGEDNTELGEKREDMILVARSGAPDANISVYPGVGIANSTIFYLDGSDSVDLEDLFKIQYRFDFQNDGIFDTDFSSNAKASYIYPLPGTQTAVVQVKDKDGHMDEAYIMVEVREHDTPPQADFTIRGDGKLAEQPYSKNGTAIGTTSTVFSFSAQSVRDNEDSSTNLQVRFDFDGDTIFDTAFSTNKRAEYRYLKIGNFTAMMQVLDSAGSITSVSKEVTIVANTDPEAKLIITPLAGTPATVFTFDPRNSRDAQYRNSSLRVRYDFNSDGIYDTKFESIKSRRETFKNPGKKSITLQVMDPEGKIATATQQVEIYSNQTPVAQFDISPREGTFSTNFVFDASKSLDPEPSSGKLQYRFDFDYTGPNDIEYDSNFSSNPIRKIQYNQVNKIGKIQVRVEVKDADGKTTTAISEISLHWSSQYIEYFRRKGVLRGYEKGEMKPDQPITRAEFTKVILETLDIPLNGVKFEQRFTDVRKTDWFSKYVLKAESLGIIQGYDNQTFRPNEPVTRAEALAIIFRAFEIPSQSSKKVFPDVAMGQWFTSYVSSAYESGLIKGYTDGSFRPHGLITRGEASKISYLASQKYDF